MFRLVEETEIPLLNALTSNGTNVSLLQCYEYFADSSLSSEKSDFQVIHLPLDGPLHSATFLVPTYCHSHQGLAHTLEHLIFCGSQRYPFGYIDHYATQCASDGTNAWTSETYTAYTVTCVSQLGFQSFLPIYLDHLLSPLLTEKQFESEVYSARDQCGVVWSEMKAREQTPSDLVDLNMRQLLYQRLNEDQQCTLWYECGGLSKDIETLTLDDIKRYHALFYRRNRMKLIVTGQLDLPALLEKLSEYFHQHSNGNEIELDPVPIPLPIPSHCSSPFQSKTVSFPSSEDEDEIQLALGFHGPSLNDLETILALQMLVRYWNETEASLLYQIFVETATPLCHAVSYEWKLYPETSVLIHFSGVKQVQQERLFYDTFCDAIRQHKLDLQELVRVLQRYLQHWTVSIHASPHESLTETLVVDVVHAIYGKVGALGERLKIQERLQQLMQKPLLYWQDLVEKYFLSSAVCQVIMVPQHAPTLKTASLHQKKKEKTAFLSEHFQVAPFPCSLEKTLPFQIQENRDLPSQTIFTCTPLIQLRFGIPLIGLPMELKPYLILYTSLLFHSAVQDDQTLLSYQQVTRLLNESFLSYDASIGMESDQGAVVGTASHLLHIILSAFVGDGEPMGQWQKLIHLISKTFHQMMLEQDRMVLFAQHLISHYKEQLRDAETVAQVMQDALFRVEFSAPFQLEFLGKVVSDKDGSHLRSFQQLHDFMAHQKLVYVQIAAPLSLSGQGLDQSLLHIWYQGKNTYETDLESKWPVSPSINCFPTVKWCISLPSAQTSSLLCSISLKDTAESSIPLILLCTLLSRTDGPLYRLLRGQGLAYDTGIRYDPQEEQLDLWINECVDMVTSWHRLMDALRDLHRSCQYEARQLRKRVKDMQPILDAESLALAKQQITYELAEQCATGSSVIAKYWSCPWRRLNAAQLQEYENKFKNITLEDLKESVLLHLSRLWMDKERIWICVAPEQEASWIARSLSCRWIKNMSSEIHSMIKK